MSVDATTDKQVDWDGDFALNTPPAPIVTFKPTEMAASASGQEASSSQQQEPDLQTQDDNRQKELDSQVFTEATNKLNAVRQELDTVVKLTGSPEASALLKELQGLIVANPADARKLLSEINAAAQKTSAIEGQIIQETGMGFAVGAAVLGGTVAAASVGFAMPAFSGIAGLKTDDVQKSFVDFGKKLGVGALIAEFSDLGEKNKKAANEHISPEGYGAFTPAMTPIECDATRTQGASMIAKRN